MHAALQAACAYIPRWLDFQLRQAALPGCTVAIVADGAVVLDTALGVADAASGEMLTPRHRFRVASHSKTFTAAAILRLRELGRVGLDDAVGRHVPGLHPDIATATLGQLLSHGAGLIRNGPDGGHFADERPYPDAAELLADLATPPILPAETRFKYSNHGYALLGQAIERVTGEPYGTWIAREIVAAAGLAQTTPDMPATPVPFARGHTALQPLGRRLVVPGDNPTRAYAPATGFTSTAADLARFFAQLAPAAAASPLTPESRRAMAHRQWRNPHVPIELHYGLGAMLGTVGGWEWLGHSGSFQGTGSRTVVVPEHGLAVSILVNAIRAPTDQLMDGLLSILRCFLTRGAPAPALADWSGRWWSLFDAVDLLPVGDRVLLAAPAQPNPVADAPELVVTAPDHASIVQAQGFHSPGEPARLVRDASGAVQEVWLGSARLRPEAAHAALLMARYGGDLAPAARGG